MRNRFPTPTAGLLFSFLILCACHTLHALSVDTVIVADGSVGPYQISPYYYVDTTTLTVSLSGESAVEYAYVPRVNGVLFAEPVDSGTGIHVHFETAFHGLRKVYYLYKPSYYDPSDSLGALPDTILTLRKGAFSREELTVSGYKSIGISVGNLGQTNLEQAMDINVFGEIADQTQLKAHLSDQGSSLDGATREISEIDMIYVSLTNPKYAVTVGDQYVRWPEGTMLHGEKKVKGLSGAFTPRNLSFKAFGSLSQGTYAVETFRGQTGLQGPYYLSGNGEVQIVSPIGGTVKAWVNGETVEEGEDREFEVDYDFGSVTFTPRILVKEDDVIRVEYEYKLYDYQRVLLGTDVGVATPDSVLQVRGALWYEADNRSQPIDMQITADDRDSLAAAGDRTYLKAMMAWPVDPRNADSVSLYTGVYVKETDSSGAEYFALTSEFRTGRELFQVPFRQVAPGTGEYTDTLVSPQGFGGPTYRGYRYVSTGGDYSARAPLPSPQRLIVGEIKTGFRPLSWLSATVDVAGREKDRNLFSDLNDDDNTGAATHSTVSLGEKRFDRQSLWLTGSHRFRSERFDVDILSAFERRDAWNDTSTAIDIGSMNSWESSLGGTPVPFVSSEITYGQLWRGDSISTDRFGNVSKVQLRDLFSISYDGNLFRHLDNAMGGKSRRDNLRFGLDLKRTSYFLSVRDEWWWDSLGLGSGLGGTAAGLDFKPLNLSEKLSFTSFRKGKKDIFSPDTGYAILWEQSFSHKIVPPWKLSATTAARHLSIEHLSQSQTSVLAHLISDVSPPKAGFSSRQKYTLSSERASLFLQEPTYVGAGLGTHVVDSTGSGDPYQTKSGGDWVIREREYTDPTTQDRVRKTSLSISWSFRPRKRAITGILADLDWRGTATGDEHVRDVEWLTGLSWIPAYLSLSGHDHDSLLTYANIYYRQTVDWRPSFNSGLRGDLLGRPFRRIVRGYEENGIEWGGGLNYRWPKWFVGGKLRFLRMDHDNPILSSTDYYLHDQYAELTQSYRLVESLEFFVKETAGFAKDSAMILDEGAYVSLKPGVTWRPGNRGWAEASYTYSSVDKDRILDFRMARGLPLGTSHIIDVIADIRLGDHFSANASYRGEISSAVGDKGLHVVSVGIKAYL